MIFSNGLDDKVRDGSKTQTRRLVGEMDESIFWKAKPWMPTTVYRNNRILWETWQTGKTYAIQSGRGKKGDGRFRITSIRKERVQDINCKDCIAEGVTTKARGHNAGLHLIVQFSRLWASLHKKRGARWEDNPEVWVLEIESID